MVQSEYDRIMEQWGREDKRERRDLGTLYTKKRDLKPVGDAPMWVIAVCVGLIVFGLLGVSY